MKVLSMSKWIIILLAVFAIGWLLLANINFENGTGSVSRTDTVKRMDLVQRVTIAGNVEPDRKTIVTAPFNGYVKKLYVKVGDNVKKGDPLVSVVQSLQSVDPVYPLRSPFNGTVVQVLKDEGEFVKQDDPKDYILRVDSLKKLYVISDVPEIDSIKIVPGQEAVIKASAILDKKYKGIVEEVSLASKLQDDWRGNSKVEYRTKIKVTDFDDDLKPGMSAIIDIITFKKESVLVLPHEYILKENDKFYALLTSGKRTKIKVGIQNESFFEITSGLTEGQQVKQVDFMEILSGQNKL